MLYWESEKRSAHGALSDREGLEFKSRKWRIGETKGKINDETKRLRIESKEPGDDRYRVTVNPGCSVQAKTRFTKRTNVGFSSAWTQSTVERARVLVQISQQSVGAR